MPNASNSAVAPRQRRFVRYPQLKSDYGIPWTRQHVDRESRNGRFAPKVYLGPNTAGFWSDQIEDALAERTATMKPRIPALIERRAKRAETAA